MKATKIAPMAMFQLGGAFLLLCLVGCTPPGPAALLEGETLLNEGEISAALKTLRKATELLPNHPQAWNLLALTYHRSGDAKEAARAYQKALEVDPNFVVARYNLGYLLLENEEFKAAESQFKTYEILVDNDPRVWVKMGTAQLGAGNLEEATASYETALGHSRTFPEAWNGLGLIRVKKAQPRKAFDYFNTAVEVDDQYAPAFLNQAIVAHQYFKKLPLALQKYRQFMFLDPNSPLTESVKALTAEINEALRPEPAVMEVPEEPEMTPGMVPLPEMVATEVVAKSKMPGAQASDTDSETVNKTPEVAHTVIVETNGGDSVQEKEEPTKLVTVAPTKEGGEESPRISSAPSDEAFEPPVVVTREGDTANSAAFEVKVTEGDYNFAVADTSPEPMAEERDDPDEWRTVSVRRSGLGISIGRRMFRSSDSNPAKSRAATRPVGLERVASVPYSYRTPRKPDAGDRRKADPYFQKGNQAFRAGRASEAILAYRGALAQDPAFFEAHYNLGLAAIKSGFPQTALEAYETALAIQPSNRNARYNFALALEQGGHFEEAVFELKTVIKNHPDDLNAHFTVATLYANQLGDAESARWHYERVLELDPNYPKAGSIRYWLSAGD
ncbi:MAG: Photosystem I assembly protein Ycf3 [Verrucomicrobia subdivision 3 bacterium]|nr:Photosystem I assembly protein Ycf3 [Limisphaerales bacterium]MCS1415870.1 Photosystem I assembly protein Ycf3 [Limisphaerales bacterium]